ncbi:unnamed protein product [Lasius platythorax]|uniref:Uncharacterized protein n=1 Tax=Lasius platythorax TaxID=488582 RepID=A0AAV2NCW8_9HYME
MRLAALRACAARRACAKLSRLKSVRPPSPVSQSPEIYLNFNQDNMCRERERDRERKSSVYLLWILSLSINIDDFNKHRNTSEHRKPIKTNKGKKEEMKCAM